MCRVDKANADDFGIFKWHGMTFIAGNVWRDLLSLNLIELLPWDDWVITQQPFRKWPKIKTSMVDDAARLTLEQSNSPEKIYDFIEGNDLFQPPAHFVK